MDKEKKQPTEFTDVPIPADIVEKVKKRIIRGMEFETVSDYVSYVLREVLEETEEKSVYSEDDEKKVKERLRALGYLD